MDVNNQIIKAIKKYDIEKAYIMMYFYDKVVMGKFVDGKSVDSKPVYAIKENGVPTLTDYCFDDELCYEIHIFGGDIDIELRWHRVEGSNVDNMEFIPITDPGEDMFFEEEMFIIGSRGERIIKSAGGATLISQYGREVILPFKVDVDENKDLKLVVHHIFDEDGNISGYRLVDIEGGDL